MTEMKITWWTRWRVVIFGFDVAQKNQYWFFIWPFVFVVHWKTIT